MRTTDALGIGGNCQKGKDRRDAYNLEKGLRERQRKNRGKLRPAIWSRQKENAPNQISDVMEKRGQGGSGLRVRKKRMILQRREFANYLRENSGVKVCGYRERSRRVSRERCPNVTVFPTSHWRRYFSDKLATDRSCTPCRAEAERNVECLAAPGLMSRQVIDKWISGCGKYVRSWMYRLAGITS